MNRGYSYAATAALSEMRSDQPTQRFVSLNEAVEMHRVAVGVDAGEVEDADRGLGRRHPADRDGQSEAGADAEDGDSPSFQTRTIRPPVLDEYTPSTASPAAVSPTRDSLAATTVAALHLRYADAAGAFFDSEMPFELEGLIPTHVYTARISRINKRLAQFRTLRDYMPVMRTTIFFIFILFSLLFVLLASQFSAVVLWVVSFVGLGSMFCALLYTYYKPAYERYIESEMDAFSAQDEHIQLLWKSARNYHQPMFTCDWSRKAAQVPWRIVITHVNKHGADAHFLPAYSPGASSMPSGIVVPPVLMGRAGTGGVVGGTGSASSITGPIALNHATAAAAAAAKKQQTKNKKEGVSDGAVAISVVENAGRSSASAVGTSVDAGSTSGSETNRRREFHGTEPLLGENGDEHDSLNGDLRMTRTDTQVSKPPSYKSYRA